MKYQYQTRERTRRKKRSRMARNVFFFLGIIFIFYAGSAVVSSFLSANPKQQNQQAHSSEIESPLVPLIEEIPGKEVALAQSVLSILADEKGDYSIYIEHLQTGETFEHNLNRQYPSASLYKLWVLGAVYQKLENGSMTKQQVMSDEIEEINKRFEIASESAERTEGSIAMTVEEALSEMITVSHNYAALLLSQTVTLSSTRAFMADYGYDDSSLDPPTTTAEDIAQFYKQLYEEEIVSTQASEEMMTLLKGQEWNDRIPKYLPKDTVIAHKTGELVDAKHDAGIVFTDSGDYIIVMLSETPSQENAAEVQAKISQIVYNYFMQKNV